MSDFLLQTTFQLRIRKNEGYSPPGLNDMIHSSGPTLNDEREINLCDIYFRIESPWLKRLYQIDIMLHFSQTSGITFKPSPTFDEKLHFTHFEDLEFFDLNWSRDLQQVDMNTFTHTG